MSQSPDDPDYWGDHPDPSDEELEELCRAWLRYESAPREGRVDDEDPDWWAVDAVMELQGEALELEWLVLRKLCVAAEGANDKAVGMIGAGPLESLLYSRGEEAMDLIEPAMDEVPALVDALQSVWMWDQPFSPRLDRCLAAKGRTMVRPRR